MYKIEGRGVGVVNLSVNFEQEIMEQSHERMGLY